MQLETKTAFKERIARNVNMAGANNYVEVHYGEYCVEDVRQIKTLGDEIVNNEHVKVVKHDFDDHTLSINLKKKGKLNDIVKKFLKIAVGDFSEEEKLEELRRSKVRVCEERSDELKRRDYWILASMVDTSERNGAARSEATS